MGMIEPNGPLDDPEGDDAPARESGTADWLCGPDEGLAAERDRAGKDGLTRPTLRRPETGEPPPPTQGSPSRIGMVTPDGGSDIVRGRAMTWEPGARSVPTLRSKPVNPITIPTQRDFPMDDAEERARAGARRVEEAAGAAAAGLAHEVVSPESFDVVVVPVPWWMQVPHALASDRRIQALVAAAMAVLVAIIMWPKGEQPVSIGSVRKHPERYENVEVLVGGRVGEVFPVGGGYAFYLQDSRDTLVVFTRSRRPLSRENVSVRGTISRGYLDGQSCLALFESTR
jgi:hypothetical protein